MLPEQIGFYHTKAYPCSGCIFLYINRIRAKKRDLHLTDPSQGIYIHQKGVLLLLYPLYINQR